MNYSHPDWREWIADNFSGLPGLDNPYADTLTAVHGRCEPDVDAAFDFLPGLEGLSPANQLNAFQEEFFDTVRGGYGLILHASSTAGNAAEWRTQELAEMSLVLSLKNSPLSLSSSQIVFNLLEAYRAQEQKLTWTCQAFGWPADWMVAWLRYLALKPAYYGPNGPSEHHFRALEQLERWDQKSTIVVVHQMLAEAVVQSSSEQLAERLNRARAYDDPHGQEFSNLSVGEQVIGIGRAYLPALNTFAAFKELEQGVPSVRAQELHRRLLDGQGDAGDLCWSEAAAAASKVKEMLSVAVALGLSLPSLMEYLHAQLKVSERKS